MQALKNEIKDLIAFSKNPQFCNQNRSLKTNLERFGILLLFDTVILVILTALFYLLSSVGFDEIFKNNENLKLFYQYPLWLIVVLTSFLIPLIEEFLFRFPLKYRRLTINFLVPTLLLLSISYALTITNSEVEIFIIVICLAALVFFAVKNKKISIYFESTWKEKFKYVFYSSTLFFALIHITNYKYSHSLILLAPLLILPQFFGGFLIGYLRIKSGFVWGLALHMTSNLILILPFVITLLTAFPSIAKYTTNYDLTVRKVEVNINQNNVHSSFSQDSIIIINQSFKKCLSILTGKNENFIQFDDSFESGGIPLLKANQQLEINYKNKRFQNIDIEKAISSSKQDIIDELKKAYDFKIVYENEIARVVFN